MKLFHVGALCLVVAGCATQALAPIVPETLRPAARESFARTVLARGVQIYECRARKEDAQAFEWAFVAPEADLFDANGARVGTHYAGPHWEALDGSKVVGKLKARADAPRAGAIPWLLVATQSDGPAGSFAAVSSIQRINTVGGVAPAGDTCSRDAAGRVARVDYTADYVLFIAK